MLDLGQYMLAVAAVGLLIGFVAVIALRLRQAILPGWAGSRARLAESVLGVGALTALILVLGTFGILRAATLLPIAAVLGALAEWGARRRGWKQARRPGLVGERAEAGAGEPTPCTEGWSEAQPQPGWSRLAAVAVAAVVTAHWGIGVSWSLDAGITNFDSVWYHLPFAAEIAQSGSTLHLIRTDTVFVNWLYPQGSEILHAAGMILTGRDILSLVLNLGWLGLAFLAAWCIGRPFGRGHLTVAAAAVLLECHNLLARTPGTAKNDIMAVALLLSAVALLINLCRSSSAPGADVPRLGPTRPGTARLDGTGPGWPLALAALAVGLAAGTKVTALAPAAGLTIAAIALSRPGDRLRASAWWLAGLAAGGAYWYLRNLIVAGNPLPQVRHLGPLSLPGPDRLQTGRPDFTVSHYLFDGTVWQDYFFPGLERGFGPLWPLALAAALAGALLAAWRLRRGQRLLGWLGVAALIGMAAYLFTPLSAAGPEGNPTAFAINLRFAIPSLMLGLVLLPLVFPGLSAARAGWVLFAALVAVGLVTNRADALATESGRLFGWALAIGLVVVPAFAGSLRRRPGGWRTALALAVALVYLLALAAVGYPLQRSYFENRYADFEPALGLSEVYRWASAQENARIGLAGTTAAFHGFGFYGASLGNEVTYLGRPAPRGGFDAITSCSAFRQAVNEADLGYLVTSPFLNFADTEAPIPSPEARWVRADPAAETMIEQGPVTLWRLSGPLATGCGPGEEPHEELPDSPVR